MFPFCDKENKTALYNQRIASTGSKGLTSLITNHNNSVLVPLSPFSAFFSSRFLPPGSQHILLHLLGIFFSILFLQFLSSFRFSSTIPSSKKLPLTFVQIIFSTYSVMCISPFDYLQHLKIYSHLCDFLILKPVSFISS